MTDDPSSGPPSLSESGPASPSSEPDPGKRSGSSAFLEQIFPGAGIGLLVGMLVGLTLTPVVSGLLTTLGGLLAAILGLAGEGSGPMSKVRVNGGRIGAFGFACVLGVLGGMTLRIKDVLATPVRKEVAAWTGAGYPEEEARRFVAFARTGLQTVGPQGEKLEVAAGDLQKARSSALFGALSEVDLCEELKLSQFGSDSTQSSGEMLLLYQRLGKKPAEDPLSPLYRELAALAVTLKSQPLQFRTEAMNGISKVVCAVQEIQVAEVERAEK